MTIRDLMTPDPATCAPDDGLEAVARQMKEHDCGAIPVVDGDELVGIVTDRDIVVRLVAAGTCPLESTARDAMTAGVVTVDIGDGVPQLTERMERGQIRRVVVTEGGRIAGIVAQADLARSLADAETGDVVEHISKRRRATGAEGG